MSDELGLPQDEPTVLNCDAENVLTITSNFSSSKQTRHIARRELIVREREIEGHLRLCKVPTADNLADMFTKALEKSFVRFRSRVMNTTSRLAGRAKKGKKNVPEMLETQRNAGKAKSGLWGNA